MVRGAALLFRQLEFVSLRRASHLSDGALGCLAMSCGAHLKVLATDFLTSIAPSHTLILHHYLRQCMAHLIILQSMAFGLALEIISSPDKAAFLSPVGDHPAAPSIQRGRQFGHVSLLLYETHRGVVERLYAASSYEGSHWKLTNVHLLRCQEVDLSGCQCLTDAGIASLARCSPNLRAIDVSSGFELTDAAFTALAACRELRSVNACGCDRLTDTGLSALVHGARCACILHLACCRCHVF